MFNHSTLIQIAGKIGIPEWLHADNICSRATENMESTLGSCADLLGQVVFDAHHFDKVKLCFGPVDTFF